MNAQQSIQNYEIQWKKVEELVKKQLPQSALAEVRKIYDLAKKEKQDAQVIKSLIYINGLQQETRENNQALAIADIEKEILESKEPVTSLLKSLQANLYWNYFQQHRWQMYNRTATTGFIKDDINTWTAEDFHQKITQLFKQSLHPENLLQKTPLPPYDAIIVKGNSRNLRPTLYDLLAHQELTYFTNEERDIHKPVYAFKLDDEHLFSEASQFAQHDFKTEDTLSNHYNALKIYQRMLAFHLNDKTPDALIDADVARIVFVNQHTTLIHKDSLYVNALEQIVQKYPGNSVALEAKFLIAQQYENLASQYQPNGDTTHRYARIKAKELAEAIIKQDAKASGAIKAYNLLQSINEKNLQFQVEKVNLPAKPFRVFVQYKNIPTLYFKLVRPTEKMKEEWTDYGDENFWKTLVAANSFKSWQQELPATNDLQQHSVEVKADGLPMGEYILVASSDINFNISSTVMGARLFYVSKISFINNQQHFFILHRETGQPLSGANMQVWRQRYNYNTSRNIKERQGHYTADANGLVIMGRKDQKDRNNFQVEINYGNDRLFMNDWMYDYDYYPLRDKEELKDEEINIYFFTDRAIYRPGQTLYFKAIAESGLNGEKEVKTNYKTTVYLHDANYQLVDSMDVTTNDFGSFSGTFKLPSTGLTGRFSISTSENEGETEIRVEEYKRPKFYVEFEKLKGTYSVNDSIQLTGMAKAYAGNNISGAKVSYRVVREPRFIYPWLSWRIWPPQSSPMEIAHGEVFTDDAGKFIITFKAIPDESLNKDLQPVFDYKIYADITDINGETRTGEEVVSVSYQSIQLEVSLPNRMAADSLKKINIITKNLAGEFVPAQVTVTIHSLQMPNRLIRHRYWEQPDQFVMSKEEFLTHFPHDEYRNEADSRSWEKKEKVFEKTDSTHKDVSFTLSGNSLAPGWYVIEIETKDEKGNIVKDVKYVEIFDDRSKNFSLPQYLWVVPSDKTLEPGEQTTIRIGTAADNVFLIQETEKLKDEGDLRMFSFNRLNNSKQNFTFKAAEEDRGGFSVNMFFIKHNRVYNFSQTIPVPWTNKELEITYGTFRDKTLPGSNEEWTMQIKGNKNEKVAAEMLASMYDASLDQFVPHQWQKPSLWPVYGNRSNWKAQMNFSAIHSIQKQKEFVWKELKKEYDRFIFDQFGYYDLPGMLRGRVAGIAGTEDMKLQEVVVTGYGVQKNQSAAPADDEMQMADSTVSTTAQTPQQSNDPAVQIRTNFNETAFFFPDLRTDKDGNIQFSFTMPEALTRWKFQAFSHTRDLSMGITQKEIITQKELMVQPNMPRFLREGDHLELTPKIVNLSDQEITGQVELMLFDALTNQPVDGWFQNIFPNQYFTAAAGESITVSFPIDIPFLFNKALTWRIVAKGTQSGGKSFSDGEENILPVLTNRILVTETLPLPMDSTGTKTFTFDKLLQSVTSETIQHQAFTIEYTSNPAWLAVQTLPYMMEYPYECSEQNWNRFYANALAMHIANAVPRIKQVFDKWKTLDTTALISNLQKNPELKSALLEETPWVLQAKSEEEQKRNIALLFDLTKMSDELETSLSKVIAMQSSNGGFSWFKGGPDDRYITQYIITGIGHLQKLGAIPANFESRLMQVVKNALPYLDKKMKEDHDEIVKQKDKTGTTVPANIAAHYLYMRSFFPQFAVNAKDKTAYNYFKTQVKLHWTKQPVYMQGMIALTLHRAGDVQTTNAITRSLKERAITHSELGMYWKEQTTPGYFWHQAPIETQALMIETFSETTKDVKTVNQLRKWLLKNKQTNHWESTRATAEAVYALLLQSSDWLAATPSVVIKAGNFTVSEANAKAEEGTGYIKKSIEGQQVNANMGNITVAVTSGAEKNKKIPSQQVSWGAAYWQYFEDMDKVTFAETPLQLNKKLFIEKNTDRGPVLEPVEEQGLKIGDKIKVRIELRVDRDMEYVHMKDLRASALEPVNVLSNYKWQDGLGYYESTRDAATHFFFSYLRKGTYVFEYSLFVTHTGTFNNGITTIQSMYAPEFTSHSEGVKIRVE
jgi:uncharacterized protein YfaS (alpha-2-macroglobulin family)